MLVSKIKPCMLQSKSLNEDPLEGKSGASSRGNSSSNSVYLVVAVKKLVVGLWVGSAGPPSGVHRFTRPFCRRCAPGLNWPGRASGAVTLKKLECSKQAYALLKLKGIDGRAPPGVEPAA
ncbi:hypothetical protein L1887_54608 [Cichorium endivia]|nr:hypothetical protein L1887_54608 [Cichorium endivia]